MSESKPDYPDSALDDVEEVVLALETGRALWGKGDLRDAVRWLRKAAERAGDAGKKARADALARVAAELNTQLTIPPAIPPMLHSTKRAEDLDGDYADKTVVDSLDDKKVSGTPVVARNAYRVSVQPSPIDSTMLLVKILREEDELPKGAREAILVSTEPGVDLLRRK